MSELTDRVRKMLAQAQVFARDTPFEAVARARQALQVAEAALANGPAEDQEALAGLRALAEGRIAKYELALSAWLEQARARSEQFNEHERDRLANPLRAKI